MAEQDFDRTTTVKLLNEILETELAGVVRYTHYSLMIFGHNRIPIVSWLRGEATTCLTHAAKGFVWLGCQIQDARKSLRPREARREALKTRK